ncbi:serine/threonine-protein kinase fhkb-related [Anaeramoeba flamelloides]|uniref:Serine/threonine-protein kinase fhkb-related n=1 Tax=Anaeramoeba flamelloides TaxID=1746091 RepID=A0ABQ8YI34_9EUKA|nr:serine/threonine-protein kinase fhkb-related [Anaeramoeba flamelloides]
MTSSTKLHQESFNSQNYSNKQNMLINKFMVVTGCKLWDTILYLNMSDWDYKKAIGTQVLCKLSNEAKKKKSGGGLDRSASFVIARPNNNGGGFLPLFEQGKFQLERKRKVEELKSTSCPNVMKAFRTIGFSVQQKKEEQEKEKQMQEKQIQQIQQVQKELQQQQQQQKDERKSGEKEKTSQLRQRLFKKKKKFVKRSLTLHEVQGENDYDITILKKFLNQKPAPRWKHRLTAFTKLDPNLTEGWPSCFQDFNSVDENKKKMRKLIVKKKLFELYEKIKIGISIKNLQRGLITFMEKQGFLNLSNMDENYFIFISYDPVYF